MHTLMYPLSRKYACTTKCYTQACHQAESLQGCGAANPLVHVCMCDPVSIPTSCKETSPFPFKLLEKAVNIKW